MTAEDLQVEDIQIPGIALGEVVGRGGFAVVYRGHQLAMGRDVAVKVGGRVLLADRDRRRFVREATSAGRLSGHPHVVTVHDAGILPDWRGYLVMEYCPHGSLQDALARSGPLAEPEVVALGADLADALAAAHGAGILHRDVKPGNVLVRADGRVALSDFGIAVPIDLESGTTSLTLTPAYAAPEVFARAVPAPPADVYALATTLQALITGAPGPGRTTLSPAVAGVLSQARHADPARRPDAAQLRDQLRALAAPTHGSPVKAPPPGSGSAPGGTRPLRSARARVIAGTTAVAAVAALTGYLVTHQHGPDVTGGSVPAAGRANSVPASLSSGSPAGQVRHSAGAPATGTATVAPSPFGRVSSGGGATSAGHPSPAAAGGVSRTAGPAAPGRPASAFVRDAAVISAAVSQVSSLIANSPSAASDPTAGSRLLQVYSAPTASGGQPLTVLFCGKPATVSTPPGPPYSYVVDAPGAAARLVPRDANFPDCLDPSLVDFTVLPRLIATARGRAGMTTTAGVSWMVTGNHWVATPRWIVKLTEAGRAVTVNATLAGAVLDVALAPASGAAPLPTFP